MAETSETQNPPAEAPKESIKDKFTRLTKAYGPILLVIHFTLFGLVMVGSFIAIKTGFESESTAGQAGTLAGAYALTQLTKPVRLAVTVALTPLVGTFVDRLRGRKAEHGPD